VGLGKIGMGYDLNLPIESFVYSHARALSVHPGFELSCAVDPDLSRRQIFEKIYCVPAYQTIEEALSNHSIDLGVIATPTEVHSYGINKLLSLKTPKAILCEKPLSSKVSDSREMISACGEKHVQLYVNYMRRSEPGAIEVKRRIDGGQIAGPIKGVVWYSKGFLHNGSHFVNLLEYWLGDLIRFDVINPGMSLNDYDATPDVHIVFEKGSIFFIGNGETTFNHHSVELIGANGRLRYKDGGRLIEWRGVTLDTEAQLEQKLSNRTEVIESDLSRYQFHVLDNLALGISGKLGRFCSGAQALATHEHVNNILETRNEQ
jgi:predicted dehydrogenase